MRTTPYLPASKMLGQWWDVPGVSQVRLQEATTDMCFDVDERWPLLRFTTDTHRHWRWVSIMKGLPERFAIVDKTGDVTALWCSSAKRSLLLPAGPCYRLDYMEIHPKLRRGEFGLFALSMVASRALETGCNHLVLGALPAVEKFYAEAGGTQRLLDGWKVSHGLLPFYFTEDALVRLKEQIDGLII